MELEEARHLLEEAERLCVLTGAGVSAESGVPTFRGPQGLWKSHAPEELATPQAFRRDPCLVWEWYEWRREKIRACRPNRGHEVLARLALGPRKVRIITQNVDGLHEEAARHVAGAGDPTPALPLELHGSIFKVRCTSCSYSARRREPVGFASPKDLPRCPVCTALLRPAVVWFGENLDSEVLNKAFRWCRAAQVCLVVGTSAVVHPAASLPLATLQAGGAVVEVNPTATPLSDVSRVSLRGPSAEILPKVLAERPFSGT